MQPDEQTSDRADLQTDRRATRQADIQPPGQTFVQMNAQPDARAAVQAFGQRQICVQASRRPDARATDARPAEQAGRTEWQDRMADRCEQMQMNAQPDCQIARYADGSICKTTRLPDALPD